MSDHLRSIGRMMLNYLSNSARSTVRSRGNEALSILQCSY